MLCRFSAVLAAFLVPFSAFAACDHERKMRDDLTSWCKTLSGVSGLTAIAGAVAIPGVGGLLGAIPGYDAALACRKKDEWQRSLSGCETMQAQLARIEAVSREKAKKVIEDFSTYMALLEKWDQSRLELSSRYSERIREIVSAEAERLRENGVDAQSEEAQARLSELVLPLSRKLEDGLKSMDRLADAEVRERGLGYVAAALAVGI